MFINKIPAKGMLFGEYGVLQNYPAVAVTFYEKKILIRTHISPSKNTNFILIKSSFFERGYITFSLEEKQDKDNKFFYNLFFPWKKFLAGFDLSIEILESFLPSLGFGSSSAIIAGISVSLYEYFYKSKSYLDSQSFWELIRSSLFHIQGGGSGYDVGVQVASILIRNNDTVEDKNGFNCWSFENQSSSSVPLIKKLNIPIDILKNYGCFLKTNIYSNTQKALAKHFTSEEKNYFAQQQGILSQQFIHDPSLQNLQILMQQSRKLAKAQGLFPEEENFQNIVKKLHGIPYKSMGAGFGDCLWVLCSKAKLIEDLNFFKEDVAFAFEEI